MGGAAAEEILSKWLNVNVVETCQVFGWIKGKLLSDYFCRDLELTDPFTYQCIGTIGSASSQFWFFSCAKVLPILTCNYKCYNHDQACKCRYNHFFRQIIRISKLPWLCLSRFKVDGCEGIQHSRSHWGFLWLMVDFFSICARGRMEPEPIWMGWLLLLTCLFSGMTLIASDSDVCKNYELIPLDNNMEGYEFDDQCKISR